MTKLHFQIDKRRDAKVRYNGANTRTPSDTHGIDRQKTNKNIIFQSIIGKSKEEAYKILSPYLDHVYTENNFHQIVKDTQEWRENNGQILLQRLETIVGKPIPKNNIDVYLTAGTSCPYRHTPNRWFMVAPLKKSQKSGISSFSPIKTINTVLHEMLHLMLHHYYEEYILNTGLTQAEFQHLKEAQTIILDESFVDILPEKDGGYNYINYIPTRKKFAAFRQQDKNFDEFVDYGIQVMKDRRTL